MHGQSMQSIMICARTAENAVQKLFLIIAKMNCHRARRVTETCKHKHQSTESEAVLHDQSKTGEDASKYSNKTVAASEIQGSLSTALRGGRRWCSSSCSSSEAGIDNTS